MSRSSLSRISTKSTNILLDHEFLSTTKLGTIKKYKIQNDQFVIPNELNNYEYARLCTKLYYYNEANIIYENMYNNYINNVDKNEKNIVPSYFYLFYSYCIININISKSLDLINIQIDLLIDDIRIFNTNPSSSVSNISELQSHLLLSIYIKYKIVKIINNNDLLVSTFKYFKNMIGTSTRQQVISYIDVIKLTIKYDIPDITKAITVDKFDPAILALHVLCLKLIKKHIQADKQLIEASKIYQINFSGEFKDIISARAICNITHSMDTSTLDKNILSLTNLIDSDFDAELMFKRANLYLLNQNLILSFADFDYLIDCKSFIYPSFCYSTFQLYLNDLKSNNMEFSSDSSTSKKSVFNPYGVEVSNPTTNLPKIIDLNSSIKYFNARSFTLEGLTCMDYFYTELLIQHGASARVYWYRANIRKMLGRISDYIIDLEKMNLTDGLFLSNYFNSFDSKHDYCDENLVVFIQWELFSLVYKIRKALILPSLKNNSTTDNLDNSSISLSSEKNDLSFDVVAVYHLMAEYYILILRYVRVTDCEKSWFFACLGDIYRQQGLIKLSRDSYTDSVRICQLGDGVIIAYSGLALLDLYELNGNAALSKCSLGLRRFQEKTQKVTPTDEEISILSKAYSSSTIIKEAVNACCHLIFLQYIYLQKKKKENNNLHSPRLETVYPKDGLFHYLDKLDRYDQIRLSIVSNSICNLLSVYSIALQSVGELLLSEQILQLATNINRQSPFSRFILFMFELRFGSTSNSIVQLKVVEKLCPYFNYSDVCVSSFHALPSFMKELPRFWNGLYSRFLTKKSVNNNSASIPILPRKNTSSNPLLESEQIVLEFLSKNFHSEAIKALEDKKKKDMDITIMAQILMNNSSSENNTSLASYLFSRGNFCSTTHSLDIHAFIDLSLSSSIVRNMPDVYVKLSLLNQRKKNSTQALEHIRYAIEILDKKIKDFDREKDSIKKSSILKVLNSKMELYRFITSSILYSCGKFCECIVEASKVIFINPQNTNALHQRSLAYSRTNQQELASIDLDLCCSICSPSIGHFIRLGNLFNSIKKYENATELFTVLLASNPKSPQVYFGLAYAQFRISDYIVAELNFRKCFHLSNNTFYLARLRQGECLERMLNYKDAMNIYSEISSKYISFPGLEFCLGRCYMRMRELNKASKHFQQDIDQYRIQCNAKRYQIDLIPDDSVIPNNIDESYYLLALVSLELGHMNSCLSSLASLFEINSNHPEGRFLRGWLFMIERKYSEAILQLNICIDSFASDIVSGSTVFTLALQSRSFCHAGENNQDLCIKDLNKLLSRDILGFVTALQNDKEIVKTPLEKNLILNIAKSLSIRGLMFSFKHEHEMALHDFDKSLELNPNSEMTLLYRAESYRQKGYTQDAISSFESSIYRLSKKFSDDPNKKSIQGDSFENDEMASSFKSKLEAPYELTLIDLAYIYNTVGILLFENKSYSNSIDKFEEAVRLNDSANFHYNKSIVLFSIQKYRLAYDELLIASEKDSKSIIIINNLAYMHDQLENSKPNELLVSTFNNLSSNSFTDSSFTCLNPYTKALFLYNVGNTLYRNKKLDDSLKVYMIACKEILNDPSLLVSLYNNQAVCECNLYRYNEGLDLLQAAISLNQFKNSILYNRAHVFLLVNKVENAMDDFDLLDDSMQNIKFIKDLSCRWMWGLSSACKEISTALRYTPIISSYLKSDEFPLFSSSFSSVLNLLDPNSEETLFIMELTSARIDATDLSLASTCLRRLNDNLSLALKNFSESVNGEYTKFSGKIYMNEDKLQECNNNILQIIYCLQFIRQNKLRLEFNSSSINLLFLWRVNLLIRDGYFQAAIHDLRFYVESKKNTDSNFEGIWYLWHVLGCLLWKVSSFDDSYASFLMATKLNPFNYLSYLNMAYLDNIFFRYSAAVACYNKVLLIISSFMNPIADKTPQFKKDFFTLKNEKWVFSNNERIICNHLTDYIKIVSSHPPWRGIEKVQSDLLISIEISKSDIKPSSISDSDNINKNLLSKMDEYLDNLMNTNIHDNNNISKEFDIAFNEFQQNIN